ncbi:MAG TPA: hypothetical protein VHY33_12805 [Thermoanaerobaculia bacterium]|nr:hypothetical protein [Thermoanaerobaculia bacterium]
MEQALERTDATHLGIQYDRRIWKAGALRRLTAAVMAAPQMTTTYGWDLVFASKHHADAGRLPASGWLYAVPTREIIERCARADIADIGQAYPGLLNCMVPRNTFDRIRARFGSICDSAAPDGAFVFRFCAVDDVFHHLDQALFVVYGFAHSNGWGYLRGVESGAWADYMKLWGDRPWIDAAPIPELKLGQNVMFHEYNLVRRAAGDRFPPIDRERYLDHLGSSLATISDVTMRSEMHEILQRHGWRGSLPEPPAVTVKPLYKRVLGPPVRPLRRFIRGVRRSVSGPFGKGHTAVFANEADAVRYLLAHEYTPRKTADNRLASLHAVPVAFSA